MFRRAVGRFEMSALARQGFRILGADDVRPCVQGSENSEMKSDDRWEEVRWRGGEGEGEEKRARADTHVIHRRTYIDTYALYRSYYVKCV